MALRFTKMHGIGNDYVFVDAFEAPVLEPSLLSRRISDRHTGVGSDGLILLCRPASAENDCRMEMYNADGSRGRMCGNGIRCAGRYLYERDIARREELRIETDAGLRTLRLHLTRAGEIELVTVDMGAPLLSRRDIPLADGADPAAPAIGIPLKTAGRSFRITAVSMGNPHAIVFTADPKGAFPPLPELPLERWGPLIENHRWFPERTNVEFVAVVSRSEIDVRVWERGSGETLACGTGACAAVVAGALDGRCERRVRVRLPGGELGVEWLGDDDSGSVALTGPAVEVFQGEWP